MSQPLQCSGVFHTRWGIQVMSHADRPYDGIMMAFVAWQRCHGRTGKYWSLVFTYDFAQSATLRCPPAITNELTRLQAIVITSWRFASVPSAAAASLTLKKISVYLVHRTYLNWFFFQTVLQSMITILKCCKGETTWCSVFCDGLMFCV